MCRFVKQQVNEVSENLRKNHPNAWLVMSHIGTTARFKDDPFTGLKAGQCRIKSTSFQMPRWQYQNAIRLLIRRKLISTYSDSKDKLGIIVTVLSKEIFDIIPSDSKKDYIYTKKEPCIQQISTPISKPPTKTFPKKDYIYTKKEPCIQQISPSSWVSTTYASEECILNKKEYILYKNKEYIKNNFKDNGQIRIEGNAIGIASEGNIHYVSLSLDTIEFQKRCNRALQISKSFNRY